MYLSVHTTEVSLYSFEPVASITLETTAGNQPVHATGKLVAVVYFYAT